MTTHIICALACLAMAATAAIPSSLAAADPSGSSTAGLAAAIRKPKLYKMLANNSRIDTNIDELRMDFVLRVAHGEVDPSAPSGDTGSQSGLRIMYDYGHSGTTDGTPTHDFSTDNPVTYINTQDSQYGQGSGATLWAVNRDQHYTILKVISSGAYDYLMISLECDLDVPDIYWDDWGGFQSHWWSNAGDDGMTWQPSVYAMVGPAATGGNPSENDMQTVDKDWCTDVASGPEATATVLPGRGDFASENPRTDDKLRGYDTPMAFIGYDDHPHLWEDGSGTADWFHNDGHWGSTGQTNWGLFTDEGFNVKDPDANTSSHTAPGVAPANSFFIEWYNPILKEGPTYATNPCYRVTSFKFQWFGLQNGNDWVPVTALTPEPVTVNNAPLASIRNTDVVPSAVDDNGNIQSTTAQGYSQENMAAFNSTTSVQDTEKDHTNHDDYNILAPGDAQNPDGSIDFKKAMHEQYNPQLHPAASAPAAFHQGGSRYRGLDGYYKLVTWPVISQQCTATPPSKYNPRNPLDPGTSSHKGSDGKYDGTFTEADGTPMAQSDMSKEIESGWTVGTAWYKFDVSRPDPPSITSVADSTDATIETKTFETLDADDRDLDLGTTSQIDEDGNTVTDRGTKAVSFAQHPRISGTGAPGDTISLFYDEPKVKNGVHIDTDNPDSTDPDTMGTEVKAIDPVTGEDAETVVDENGNWQIDDPNPVDQTSANVGARTRRYHAYQTKHDANPTLDMQLASNFSCLSIASFLQTPGTDPSIEVTVPHTVNGNLSKSAKLTFTVGTNIPAGMTAEVKLTASSTADPTKSMEIMDKTGLTDTDTSSVARIPVWATPPTGTGSNATGGVTTAQFDQFKSLGINVHFTATLATSGTAPATGTLDYRCNMDAPVVTISSIDHNGISGSVTAQAGGNATATDEEGGRVSVTWIDADGTAHKAKKTAIVAADGTWSAPLYNGVYAGTVEAQATDADGNQSARPSISQHFDVGVPVAHLPTTGSGLGLLPLIAAAGVALTLIASASGLTTLAHRHRAAHARG